MRKVVKVAYSAKVKEKPVVRTEITEKELQEIAIQYGHELSAKRRFWQQQWTALFYLTTQEELKKWEQNLNISNCNCGSFYHEWKKLNPIEGNVTFEWKWGLKSCVNAKLNKSNISLEEARWQYRFTGQRNPVHNVISTADLIKDSKLLAKLIYNRHKAISGIAGVARSGMLPAVNIALELGLDLYEATPDKLRLISGGVRRVGGLHGDRRVDSGGIIIVDDSTCSGYAAEKLRAHNVPIYTVYAANRGANKVDGYAVPLELPHLFEWNLFHNGLIFNGMNAAFDMDGVFCEDCPVDCDDDGEKYVDWMNNVQPINYSIEYEIPLIVTARREQYRKQTEQWLDKYGIRVKHIEMFPGSFDERSKTNIGQWKADIAKKYDSKIFIESSYHQAIEINKRHPNSLVVSMERNPYELSSRA